MNSLYYLRDPTGKLLLTSKSRDGSAAVESESRTHPADRNTALSDDGGTGLPCPANSVSAVRDINASSAVSARVAVAE